MGKKKQKAYGGDEEYIILSIPKNTIKLKIVATCLINGDIKKCVSKLNYEDIAEARSDYLMLDPTDDAFDTYVINPEYADFLEKWKDKGLSYEEISDKWAQSHDR